MRCYYTGSEGDIYIVASRYVLVPMILLWVLAWPGLTALCAAQGSQPHLHPSISGFPTSKPDDIISLLIILTLVLRPYYLYLTLLACIFGNPHKLIFKEPVLSHTWSTQLL